MGGAAKKFGKFVGWVAILMLVVLIGYYGSIVGWAFDFLAASPALEWGNDAQSFFHKNILTLTDSAENTGGISVKLVWGIIAAYVAVYFSIFKGLKSVGAVVKWTVPIPFLLLFVLFLNSTTLDGAVDGFKYFLTPDWDKFFTIDLWKNAVSMSLFSTNVGLALTMLYASFNKEKTDIVQSAWWIGIGDLLVSLIAGLAMFGTLGYMAQSTGVPVSEVVESGPTLAFVTIPTALAALPFAPGVFATLFFLAILTLAIDSVFAILETISASVRNQFPSFKKIKYSKFTLILCALAALWSMAFATGNGLYRLDVMDHFLFSHLFYIGVVLQLIVVGWIYGADKVRKHINSVSKYKMGTWFNVMIKYIGPLVFAYLYISTLPKELSENYGGYSTEFLWTWGYGPLLALLIISALLACKSKEKK